MIFLNVCNDQYIILQEERVMIMNIKLSNIINILSEYYFISSSRH